MEEHTKSLVRGALLLAIALVVQQLRLLVPLPVMVMTLIIGTVVNGVLLLCRRTTTKAVTVAVSFALPFVACAQGHILPPVIPVIFVGNTLYAMLAGQKDKPLPYLILTAPAAKALCMGAGLYLVLTITNMPSNLRLHMVKAFIPIQWATGITGLFLADLVSKRIDVR